MLEIEEIEQLRHTPLRRLAKILTSWLEPIVMMWRFNKSNGPTEGFHNKMVHPPIINGEEPN